MRFWFGLAVILVMKMGCGVLYITEDRRHIFMSFAIHSITSLLEIILQLTITAFLNSVIISFNQFENGTQERHRGRGEYHNPP